MHEQIDRNTSNLPIIGPGDSTKHQSPHFARPVQMVLFARVTCYPPLGQVTSIPRVQKKLRSEKDHGDTVRFTVTIESSTSLPDQPWEAQIWHNISDPDWTALPLHETKQSAAPLLSGNATEYRYYRHIFAGQIQLPSVGGHAQFTVRFRTSPETDWQWVNPHHSVGDGEIVYTARESGIKKALSPYFPSQVRKEELAKYITNLSQDIQVESRTSEAPGSLLWSISGNVSAAANGASGISTLLLGTPSIMRNFSLVRVWSPWLGPRHGRDWFDLTEDAILCSFLRKDGLNLVLLAISGINDVLTVFQSGDNGEVVIKARNDNTKSAQFNVLAAVAEDFEVAMSALIYESRKVVKPFSDSSMDDWEETSPISPLDDDIVFVEKDPKIQWLAEWFDDLTFCTWNSLGQDLTEEKLLQSLESLKSHGISISNLIIDDNWQSLDNEGESQFRRRWQRFEANEKAFPGGLKRTVDEIRQKNPNIQHVAVWHALFGYWGGISPDGDLARKYKTKEVQVKDPSSNGPIAQNIPEGKILAIDPDDIQRFYEGFYSYLNTVGVDSVKTDAQFFLDLLENYGIWALEDFICAPGYLFRRSYALQHQPAVGLSAVFLEQMPGYILAVVAAVVGLTQNYPPARWRHRADQSAQLNCYPGFSRRSSSEVFSEFQRPPALSVLAHSASYF
ncbi:hypothetical protein DTO002I6_9462 [Penicillium roqueforti]|nr:hypothetical protein DTO002I6_9462 [Penicillium roqueforti]